MVKLLMWELGLDVGGRLEVVYLEVRLPQLPPRSSAAEITCKSSSTSTSC